MTDPQERPPVDLGDVAAEPPQESTDEERELVGEDTGQGGTVPSDDSQ